MSWWTFGRPGVDLGGILVDFWVPWVVFLGIVFGRRESVILEDLTTLCGVFGCPKPHRFLSF